LSELLYTWYVFCTWLNIPGYQRGETSHFEGVVGEGGNEGE